MPKIKEQKSTMKVTLLLLAVFFSLLLGYSNFNKVKEFFKPDLYTVGNHASIAVLPFVNRSRDADQDYFSDGLTDEILNSLTSLEGLKVSSRNSSFKFRGKEIDIREVGEKLGVRTVLEGSVQRQGDRILITAQLINVENNFQFWSEQYDEKLDNVFDLQNRIATAIAEKLKITLVDHDQLRMINKPTVNKNAFELYLRARSYWNLRTPKDLQKAIELFEEAILLDPAFAAAYSGLADSYTALGYGSFLSPKEAFVKARQAAVSALMLDSLAAEPHATLGFYNFYYAWDWEAAEQEFRTALALNPNYALAYDWYGYYLTAMERYDEARIIFRKAESLDPLSALIHTDMGFGLYYSGNYDEAVKELKLTLEMNPQFGLAHLWLGRSYQQQGRYDSAVSEYKRARAITGDWPVAIAAIGNVYGISGDIENAKYILNDLNSLSKKKFVTPYGVALVYAGLNEKEQAFSWLTKAYDERSHWLVWLKTDPRWNSIRNERPFIELINKVGLPH